MITVHSQQNQTRAEDKNSDQPGNPYELNITITRHGPKESLGGPLSVKGRELVREYYSNKAHSDINTAPRKVFSSPIGRAKETAGIYQQVLKEYHGGAEVNVEEDERLSEMNLVEFIDGLNPDQKVNWFQYWYASDAGKKAVQHLSQWLLEQANKQKLEGGSLNIHAFSHGPVMAGFVLRLEEILDKKLLSPVSEIQRLDISRLFANPDSAFDYLGSINCSLSSDNPELIKLSVQDVILDVSLDILRDV